MKREDEGVFRTHHRHTKPIGNSKTAQMIPHNPNVVVASCSPFAHWASTRGKRSEFSELSEKGKLTSVPVFMSNPGFTLLWREVISGGV